MKSYQRCFGALLIFYLDIILQTGFKQRSCGHVAVTQPPGNSRLSDDPSSSGYTPRWVCQMLVRDLRACARFPPASGIVGIDGGGQRRLRA